MKYIQPMEISSKIMTLIDLSNEQLIIVSPYVNFKKWDKMKACLKRAITRGVKIEFYIRDNADIDIEQFSELNIKPIRKENLHAKLYYNETYGIVTSQNMIRYSDDYSIDIGYETDTNEELNQLRDFKSRYLEVKEALAPWQIQAVEVQIKSTEKILAYKNFDSLSAAIMELTQKQAGEVYNALNQAYPTNSFTQLSTYVFSDDLLDSADTMIGTSLLLKFPHDNGFCRFLKNIDLIKLNNKFQKQVDTSGRMHTYIAFTPSNAITLSDLLQNYFTLISEIKSYVNPYSGNILTIDQNFDWNKYLYTQLRDTFSKRIKVYYKDNHVNIYNGPDQYSAFIAISGRNNNLRLSCKLSHKELSFLAKHDANLQSISESLTLELGYDSIWGTYTQHLSTHEINALSGIERKQIADTIIKYITSVTELKNRCN